MRRFISLLSGGLDSPIATFLMIKKGYVPTILSFLTSDDIEQTMKKKIIAIIKKLKTFSNNEIKVYFINHDPNLDVFKMICERKLTCILCKRLMIRISREIGLIEGTNLLITGDILGEQASQTLENLYSYNELLNDFILLRPLISCNKSDIIKISEKIGLYEFNSQHSASCQYYPKFPETRAKMTDIHVAESSFEYNTLVKNSLKNAEILYF